MNSLPEYIIAELGAVACWVGTHHRIHGTHTHSSRDRFILFWFDFFVPNFLFFFSSFFPAWTSSLVEDWRRDWAPLFPSLYTQITRTIRIYYPPPSTTALCVLSNARVVNWNEFSCRRRRRVLVVLKGGFVKKDAIDVELVSLLTEFLLQQMETIDVGSRFRVNSALNL